MGRRQKFSQAAMIAALDKTRGLITHAAAALGCSRTTVQSYIDRHPAIAAARTVAVEKQLDIAEGALFKAIDKGEGWAVCFFLKCKGKARGYVERQEITGKDGAPIPAMRGRPLVTIFRQRSRMLEQLNGGIRQRKNA